MTTTHNSAGTTEPVIVEHDVTVHLGHVQDVLPTIAAGSVNCVVTSPPYYGLRSYLPNGVVLRDDLTDEDRAYVLGELKRLGLS